MVLDFPLVNTDYIEVSKTSFTGPCLIITFAIPR